MPSWPVGLFIFLALALGYILGRGSCDSHGFGYRLVNDGIDFLSRLLGQYISQLLGKPLDKPVNKSVNGSVNRSVGKKASSLNASNIKGSATNKISATNKVSATNKISVTNKVGKVSPWFERKYFEGLTYLLNDQADEAMDTFVTVMDVTEETLETHLSLGNLMRRRGELGRAVKIHQNLLSSESLSLHQSHAIRLELATDYIRSGLLDRAEALLKDLLVSAQVDVAIRKQASEHLIEIYQDLGDWVSAIDIAEAMVERNHDSTYLRSMQSHFSCELAQQAKDKNDGLGARLWLSKALKYDKANAHALIKSAELAVMNSEHHKAIFELRSVAQLHPEFTPDLLPILSQSYFMSGNPQGLRSELDALYQRQPSLVILLEIVDGIEASDGASQALDFWLAELPRFNDIEHELSLLRIIVEGTAPEQIDYVKIRSILRQVIQSKLDYECGRCGYTAKHLHWLCPGCKHWASSFVKMH